MAGGDSYLQLFSELNRGQQRQQQKMMDRKEDEGRQGR